MDPQQQEIASLLQVGSASASLNLAPQQPPSRQAPSTRPLTQFAVALSVFLVGSYVLFNSNHGGLMKKFAAARADQLAEHPFVNDSANARVEVSIGLSDIPQNAMAPGGPLACEAATALVKDLRHHSWPWPGKAPAPRIAGVVYINLDWDAHRRQWMENQLERLKQRGNNFAIQRFAAIDQDAAKTDPRFEAMRARGFNAEHYPPIQHDWTVAACLFSHIAALWELRQQAAALLARHEVWMVLEDDATLPDDLEQAWEQLWPYVPEEWDVLRIGWFGPSTCAARVNQRLDLALWHDPPPKGPCGAQAYIVNPASIDRVLHRLEDARIMHADCLLGTQTPPLEDPSEFPYLKSFATQPTMSDQDSNFLSDREKIKTMTGMWGKITG